ncbi:MAG: class I SAM-dependent methyltransferase [Verrucomicrobiota bacterium JB023]|nr:class I SAM-dependent methyltransferase [Verrucomicrobiota bacterium JB023]
MRRQVKAQGLYEAGHYYSPIPSEDEINTEVSDVLSASLESDINLRADEQVALVQDFAQFHDEIPFRDEKGEGEGRYYYNQPWFCHSDAIMLYCMIRKFQFKKIVEVGSGFSSAVMLDTTERFGPKDCEFTFVEPYPDRLNDLVDVEKQANVTLVQDFVQKVDLEIFKSLDEGDLLFIDSSHVVKYQSDLHYLMFVVLPLLKKGVIVHFHDVFYPFEYPEDWLKEGRFWNECYLLRAFLTGNSNWEIVLFNHYMNEVHGEVVEKSVPLCRKNYGGSFYLRKLA